MLRRARLGLVGVAISVSAAGCAPDDVPAPLGPVGRLAVAAASDARVPADLLLAIAEVEGGLRLRWHRDAHVDDLVPVAGLLEIRHGAFDSLGRGAALSGRGELDLVADLELGTFAGAAVVAELGRRHGASDALASWAPVVEELSGHATAAAREDYRARIFSLLRHGGLLRARGGETIRLPAHGDVPLSLTLTYPAVAPLGTPDYAGATWIDTSCDGKCNTSRNASIEMIAVHDTEGGWDASVATLQNDPGKSVHYIVDADGSRVAQFIPESYNGWHVGNSHFNNRMVGIEHVGYSGEDDYQTAMYAASADLVKDIAKRNDVPLDRSHIVAHQEVPDGVNIAQDSPPCPDSPGDCIASGNYGGSNHHTDPGTYWEWCQYMEMVGGVCKCNDTFGLWNCVHDLSMMNTCKDGVVEIVHCADACVVEPIGTDDHCTPVAEGGGGGGAGGAGGAGAGPASGGGGAGGAGASAAAAADLSGDEEDDGSCALGRSRAPAGAAAVGLLGLAGLALGRRRRRA